MTRRIELVLIGGGHTNTQLIKHMLGMCSTVIRYLFVVFVEEET